jgi:hypothetical protein
MYFARSIVSPFDESRDQKGATKDLNQLSAESRGGPQTADFSRTKVVEDSDDTWSEGVG